MDKERVEESSYREPAVREPFYKRPFDLTILVVAHIFPLFLPVWVLLWIAIPLAIWLADRGPIFYRQKRAGRGGKAFTVLKFRTMVKDADDKGPAWTLDDDRRLTPVGRLLRKTALDELPQLFSIWTGDMSLVGPRALDYEEQQLLETQVSGFASRLRVRPGLTGLAQVYDQRDEAHTKLAYDLEYIRRLSLWLDTKLVVVSAWNTILGRWDRRAGKRAQQADEQHLGDRKEP